MMSLNLLCPVVCVVAKYEFNKDDKLTVSFFHRSLFLYLGAQWGEKRNPDTGRLFHSQTGCAILQCFRALRHFSIFSFYQKSSKIVYCDRENANEQGGTFPIFPVETKKKLYKENADSRRRNQTVDKQKGQPVWEAADQETMRWRQRRKSEKRVNR